MEIIQGIFESSVGSIDYNITRNSIIKTADEEKDIINLKKECSIMLSLRGLPNIVQLIPDNCEEDTLEIEACVYGNLEYLYEQLKFYSIRGHSIPYIKIAEYFFSQLINAVESCHARNIVHHDIKPDNIFIGEGFVLKLGDFGNSTIGTNILPPVIPGYNASPELIAFTEKKEIQPTDFMKADIYAMGLLLYYMLFGEHFIYDELSYDEVCDKISRLNERITILPPNIQDLLKGMIKIEPDARLSLPKIKILLGDINLDNLFDVLRLKFKEPIAEIIKEKREREQREREQREREQREREQREREQREREQLKPTMTFQERREAMARLKAERAAAAQAASAHAPTLKVGGDRKYLAYNSNTYESKYLYLKYKNKYLQLKKSLNI
jgi:serine/threonine protein kinase